MPPLSVVLIVEPGRVYFLVKPMGIHRRTLSEESGVCGWLWGTQLGDETPYGCLQNVSLARAFFWGQPGKWESDCWDSIPAVGLQATVLTSPPLPIGVSNGCCLPPIMRITQGEA